MAAGLLIFPGAQPSRSRNGGAVIAELRWYQNQTTIPKPVYADEAMTVPLPFPVVSDDAGRFVAMWAEEGELYTANWSTADGQTLTLDDLSASLAADAMILAETQEAVEFIEGLVAGYAGTVLYNFSTTTTDADPGPGNLRFNDSTIGDVSFLYVDNIDANSVDATGFIDSLAIGDIVTIRSLVDSADFGLFTVSGAVIDGTGYRKVPVTWLDGANIPADGAGISVMISPIGAQGPAGGEGWTPELAVVADGARYVQQVADWFGGAGVKPPTGEYVGPTGFVTDITQAVNIRGASGAGTGDVNGPSSSLSGTAPVFGDTTGKLLADSKVTLTPPTTGATITVADGKTLTASNTLTLAGTDGSTLNVGAGGTLGPLAVATSPTANNVILGNGSSAPQYVAPGTSGNVLTSNGTTWESQAGGGGGAISVAIIQDQKSNTTAGQSMTGGAWNTRDLNTEVSDPDSIVPPPSSNRFTPIAGTYLVLCEGSASSASGAARSRIYNVTDAAVVAQGPNGTTDPAAPAAAAFVPVVALITTDGAKAYEYQTRPNGSGSTGAAVTAGVGIVEVYSTVTIMKLA